MINDVSTQSPAQLADRAAQEAAAARRAIEAEAMSENARQVAALSDVAHSGQQAEHIRAVVDATMSQISMHASSATRENATRWQTWALGLADGLDRGATPAFAL